MQLSYGVGTPETGGCWMAAISYYQDEKWGDHPSCVDPVIRSLAICVNDHATNDNREKLIGPHLFDPIGTERGLAASYDVASRALLAAYKACCLTPHKVQADGKRHVELGRNTLEVGLKLLHGVIPLEEASARLNYLVESEKTFHSIILSNVAARAFSATWEPAKGMDMAIVGLLPTGFIPMPFAFCHRYHSLQRWVEFISEYAREVGIVEVDQEKRKRTLSVVCKATEEELAAL